MFKKKNRGFSIVEILISITIFAILMIPIVSGIISSLNSSTSAKNLQYRNDFAENLMEYVKQDSLENIITGTYFDSIGIYNTSKKGAFYVENITKGYDSSLNDIASVMGSSNIDTKESTQYSEDLMTSDKTYYPYEIYDFSGTVKLGTKHTPYVYNVEISNEYYAQKEKIAAEGGGTYSNPNNLALGVVEDIDYTKIALINGTIANYDSAVTETYLTKKAEALKQYAPDLYQIYMNQAEGGDYFTKDSATRMIAVVVKGSAQSGYTVECKLVYHDNNESGRLTNSATGKSYLDDYYVEYTPFTYNYDPVKDTNGTVVEEAFLPNIYLMYNVCLYNGVYSADDYIVVDTSLVTDDTPVNLFVVQTAKTYSDALLSADASLSTSVSKKTNKTLYNTNILDSTITHDDVRVHLAATSGTKLSNLSVYHNLDDTAGTNVDGVKNYIYKEGAKLSGKNNANKVVAKGVTDGLDVLSSYKYPGSSTAWTYKGLATSSEKATVDKLDAAKEESRGLYRVKIWMEEGTDPSAIDKTKEPIITGTKGGNQS